MTKVSMLLVRQRRGNPRPPDTLWYLSVLRWGVRLARTYFASGWSVCVCVFHIPIAHRICIPLPSPASLLIVKEISPSTKHFILFFFKAGAKAVTFLFPQSAPGLLVTFHLEIATQLTSRSCLELNFEEDFGASKLVVLNKLYGTPAVKLAM